LENNLPLINTDDTDQEKIKTYHGGTESRRRRKILPQGKPLKHGGTEVAEEKDFLAICSDPRYLRQSFCFSDSGDDVRCRRFV
jgi:hypothetical protein